MEKKATATTVKTPGTTSLLSRTNTLVDFALQIFKLAKGAQFYWFLSLVSTLYFSVLCIISSYLKGSDHMVTSYYYTHALLSILLTYILVLRQVYQYTPFVYLLSLIYKSIKIIFSSSDKKKAEESQAFHAGMDPDGSSEDQVYKQRNKRNQDLNNMLRNENVQYLLFAFFHWVFSSPYYGAINPSVLYPYVIYAFFHTINYTKQFLIPIMPNITPLVKEKWCKNLNLFHQMFNNRSRMLASNTEIMLTMFYVIPLIKVFFRLVFGKYLNGSVQQIWIDFKTIFLFLVTINFLRMRHTVDQYTKTQIIQYDSTINNIVWNSNIPEVLRQVLASIKYFVAFFIDKFTLTI